MATRKKSARTASKTARIVVNNEVKNDVKSEGKAHSGSKDNGTIQPAKGKLGVMIPGMGAVATTFVAGVEAIRKGLAKPIGSLTQMGTVRLGKRTDGRSPKIKEFVPLAGLDDLVFTGWDIFEDNMYEAGSNAGVLDQRLLDQLKPFLTSVTPRAAVFDHPFRNGNHTGTVGELPDDARPLSGPELDRVCPPASLLPFKRPVRTSLGTAY